MSTSSANTSRVGGRSGVQAADRRRRPTSDDGAVLVRVVDPGGAAATAGALGGLLVAFRDANPASVAEVAATDALPPAEPPRTPSYWPVVGVETGVLIGWSFRGLPGFGR